jgi:hypothetical protein
MSPWCLGCPEAVALGACGSLPLSLLELGVEQWLPKDAAASPLATVHVALLNVRL